MSASGLPPTDRVAALRQQFDESFAQAPSARTDALETLLDVRCGGARYAIRLREITALIAGVRITPLAAPLPQLLGMAGIRGMIVPVYDLGAMLGQPADAKPRWMAMASSETPVALAFGQLERHLRVPPDAFAARYGGDAAHPHSRDVVTLSGGALPVISIPSVLEDIVSRVRACRDTRGQ